MPYRRLPNTDSARLKALKVAVEKATDKLPSDRPFSQATQHKLSVVIPKFEGLLNHRKEASKHQKNKSSDYHIKFKKARNYISHFLQVLNLAVIRGDLKADARTFYKLKKDDTRIPVLRNEQDIIEWGDIIQKGEAERILKGGNPMTNPTIGIVRVHYDKFITLYQQQKTLQDNLSRTTLEVNKIRETVDEVILTLWNEIEDYFSDLDDIEKRNICREYGVVYFFRRSEIIDEKENVTDDYRENRVKDKALRMQEEQAKQPQSSPNKNEEPEEEQTENGRLVQYSLF